MFREFQVDANHLHFTTPTKSKNGIHCTNTVFYTLRGCSLAWVFRIDLKLVVHLVQSIFSNELLGELIGQYGSVLQWPDGNRPFRGVSKLYQRVGCWANLISDIGPRCWEPLIVLFYLIIDILKVLSINFGFQFERPWCGCLSQCFPIPFVCFEKFMSLDILNTFTTKTIFGISQKSSDQ